MKVLNIKSTPDWRSNPRNLYCGRANSTYNVSESVHHNPFPLESEAKRGSTLFKYNEYLKNKIETDLMYRAKVTCLDSVADNLVCWCHPHPCHCDMLLLMLERLNFDRPFTYAGIGSRETPAKVLEQMKAVAGFLAMCGYTMRSGGAEGADTAFEIGHVDQLKEWERMEIFLPWSGFNNKRPNHKTHICIPDTSEVYKQAEQIAEQFHPAWHRLTRGGKALQTRNVFQIMGPDLKSPSHFVVCWTKDGQATGGTGQAIRIAQAIGIPVYNLFNSEDVEALLQVMKVPV